MAVERPTFHESWYRVAPLRPRLLSTVQVHRQYFRGQMWYVLENPSNNEFSRISETAWRFIGMLDGRRTVADVWRACNEQFGDAAPTQGEAIGLLGQLYCSNLLYAELPPDSESLFNRYRTRIQREIQGFLANLLFVRVPLIDPDHFLERWVGVVGWLFGWLGLVLWLSLLATGLYFLAGNLSELVHQSSDILAPDNLILLYLSIILIKIFHEFGHAFACKRFGKLNGAGGQVHAMGIMFLVFVPLPYVDASSSWVFRKKWHRAVVGMAGVLVELAGAAVAAIVWANTSTGTLHIIAYNIMFVASVSTLIFNANPLLRFDGYYVLSDLLEIPNLGQRSKNYMYYLVRKYFWAVKGLQNPANSLGEGFWFIFYGIVSTAYRVFICIRILLFLNNRLPKELSVLVPLFAASAIIAWIVVPVGKFLRYLVTSTELARTRGRAMASVLGGLALTVGGLGILRVPDYCRVEGIVEPVALAIVHAESDGFVTGFLTSEQQVAPGEKPLVEAVNPKLEAEKKSLQAELQGLQIRQRLAEMQEIAAAQILTEQIDALQEKIDRVNTELSSLRLQSTIAGTWVSPDIEKAKGEYLRRGEPIGVVASLDRVQIRATAGQELAARLEQAYEQLEIRIKGRPEALLQGKIEKILPAGQDVLPSQALGYMVGGSMPTLLQDPDGVRTAEKFFEILITPSPDSPVHLLCGQRIIARIQMPAKPLALRWWQSSRRLFQRRFHI